VTLLTQQLAANGLRDLVSVIPPNATLSPMSKINATQLGKTPGRKNANGTWGGYDWLKYEPTEDDLKSWALSGANIGILARRFPGVDIDTQDPDLSRIVSGIALDTFGPAPARVGRAPKTLLMYRLANGAEPFARMAVVMTDKTSKQSHLIEVLGDGRQYVIAGTHPSGSAYSWDRKLENIWADNLSQISKSDVEAFFARLTEELGDFYIIERVGDGTVRQKNTAQDQDGLKAPSPEALAECVTQIANPENIDRDGYIKMGYAVRAAGQDFEEEAYQVFLDWTQRWEGGDNAPETVRLDWRKMGAPYSIGWNWLLDQAPKYKAASAVDDFAAVEAPTQAEEKHAAQEEDAPMWSEQWLADQVVETQGGFLRFVKENSKWFVWDGARWNPDNVNMASERISTVLRFWAGKVLQQGASPQEIKESLARANRFASAACLANVRTLCEKDPRISVASAAFDADPWILNTPAGVIELKTGTLVPASSDRLCSKTTLVGPDKEAGAPEFLRFLAETTGGDRQMERYLQQVVGYSLTGRTQEQILFFVWGPGGNGKSVFLNAVTSILGDYAQTASMDTFISSNQSSHPTDLAGMQGARLVAASEVQAGRRWDEQRLKSLTGGEKIRARFMRQDFFEYLPQFKLFFVGNHKPEIRNVDPAMRRRIHLVPFTVTPAKVDKLLSEKLRAEYPAILAWAIEGCLDWQANGLQIPATVKATTEDYFDEQDAIGRWLADCTERSTDAERVLDLFQSWEQWANKNREYVGSVKRFTQALDSKHLDRVRRRTDGTDKASFILGIKLRPQAVEDFA